MTDNVLVVCLLTYKRTDYAKLTIESALRNISFSGSVRVHIGDDGSGEDHLKALIATAAEFKVPITLSDSERRGYGANYNLATQQAHIYATHVLYLEDDWILTRPLDVDYIVSCMDVLGPCCVRLGYMGFTQDLRAKFVASGTNDHWLLLDSDSPEPHVFAGHPRIETVEWSRRVGLWPEGLAPGATEFAVAHIKEARQDVYWPLDVVTPRGGLFAHVGSIRSTDA